MAHVAVLVVVPVFVGLFWWQVQRVRQGNTLSWAYVFEWPIFTAYAVYFWWKLVHDQGELPGVHPAGDAGGDPGGRPGVEAGAPTPLEGRVEGPAAHGGAEGEPADEELAAYNRYLAELHASGRRKRW
jgi:hypothetical protein